MAVQRDAGQQQSVRCLTWTKVGQILIKSEKLLQNPTLRGKRHDATPFFSFSQRSRKSIGRPKCYVPPAGVPTKCSIGNPKGQAEGTNRGAERAKSRQKNSG
ncbi:MAG: hypothetical protein MR971_04015 [Bacteroidales bacterium]|nr:hypothetical protein [Bacteroidales bacterium]